MQSEYSCIHTYVNIHSGTHHREREREQGEEQKEIETQIIIVEGSIKKNLHTSWVVFHDGDSARESGNGIWRDHEFYWVGLLNLNLRLLAPPHTCWIQSSNTMISEVTVKVCPELLQSKGIASEQIGQREVFLPDVYSNKTTEKKWRKGEE